LLALGALLGGCAKATEDISSDPDYSGVLWHVFETRNDMIVFSNGINAMRLERPGEAGAPELSELPPGLPYQGRNGNIIVGVLPAGSRFQVTSIKKSWSTTSGDSTSYAMTMLTPEKYRGWGLSGIGLVDYGV